MKQPELPEPYGEPSDEEDEELTIDDLPFIPEEQQEQEAEAPRGDNDDFEPNETPKQELSEPLEEFYPQCPDCKSWKANVLFIKIEDKEKNHLSIHLRCDECGVIYFIRFPAQEKLVQKQTITKQKVSYVA